MSSRNLNLATNALAKYFGLYTLGDLARNIASGAPLPSTSAGLAAIQGGPTNQSQTNNNPRPSGPEIALLIQLIIDTTEGGLTTASLIKRVNDYLSQGSNNTQNSIIGIRPGDRPQDKINQIVKIFYGGAHPNGTIVGSNTPAIQDLLGSARQKIINSNLNSPSKEFPGLSIIQVNESMIAPATKNTNAVVLFMNSIPSVELSRAVPYINVEFQFAREPESINKRAQTLSVFKFLEGAQKIGAGSTNDILVQSSAITSSIGGQTVRAATAGMELFTTPQTLVNANTSNDPGLRSAPVLDKFRPFMSLKNLEIIVQPAGGLMSFKTGKLEMILHDKSRLAEMSDFVSPNLYSQTELLIEYGWSHPDGPDKENYYGNLINGMRAQEKYGIINSSFAFDNAGQVQITLHLAMRGGTEFRTETIADGDDTVRNLLRDIEGLQRSIGEIRRRRAQNQVQGSREIRGVQILDAADDARSNLVLSTELRAELRNFRNQTAHGSNPDLRNLRNQITQLFGTGGRSTAHGTSLTEQLQHTIQSSINAKFEAMSNGAIPDPFITAPPSPAANASNPNNRVEHSNNNRFSLGQTLLYFIGQPLAMTNHFDDVQLLFYPFNSCAGYAHDKNISEFVVNKQFFISQYTQYRLNNLARNGNMQLRDFLTFIGTTMIDDLAAESYGLQMRGIQHRRTNAGTANEQVVSEVTLDAVQMQNAIERRLRNVTPDGTFRMPQVDFYIEAIPEDPRSVGENNATTDSRLRTILRIHIFDKTNTSFDSEAALLAASRDEVLTRISTNEMPTSGSNPGVLESHRRLRQQAIDRAVAEGIIRRIDHVNNTSSPSQTSDGGEPMSNPNGVYVIEKGPQAIKEFVMKTVPYIIHGAQGTAVKQAGLSSMQDSALSTVNLIRSPRSGPQEANGERPGGLPLQLIPCELAMTTFGCPIIEYGQQFFVDFSTGTTGDNLYAVNSLTHNIGPGRFDTEMRLIPLDAYGTYTSIIDRLGVAGAHIDDMESGNTSTPANQLGQNTPR